MTQTKLLQYFPMIRTRDQILLEIRSDPSLNARFEAFSQEARKEFLDICTGEKGVKILYDSFFRSVMDPERYPERLQAMLSCILGMQIASFHVLESSSFALGDVKSLVIMDIVVELVDGSIINLEVQKIGYDFPGERAACYASDLTLRQYARAKRDAAEKALKMSGHTFSYRSIHPVYTIVLIEKSPGIFSKFPDQYIHRFTQRSDTGLSMELLHNYIFIPLDIFKKKHQNENIIAELDAWVTFLSTEEAGEIMRLCDAYPFFRDTYSLSRNTRGFRHEIRVQSDTRLHRGYILVMKNKSLRRIADVRSGRCLAPRASRQERRDVLEKHISNLMISSGDSRRTVPNYR